MSILRFAADVTAARFDHDFRPVFELLGYEIRGDQVIVPNMSSKDVPLVNMHSDMNGLTLLITPHGMPQMELEHGMWLVKIGSAFVVMFNSVFEKIEVAL